VRGRNTAKAGRAKIFQAGLLFAGCLVALLVAAPWAEGATITLGSPLTAAFGQQTYAAAGTDVQTALPGATVVSPSDGTVVSWQVIGASGGPFHLQVVHPLGGGLFTSSGSATSGAITGPGVLTFSANLPIKAGDQVGLEANSGDKIGYVATAGATFEGWAPPLLDGGSGQAPGGTGPGELGFNATVSEAAGPTGDRAAALAACKKRAKKHHWSHKRLKKCRSKANLLPT
jgi:hypothetical protein